jgi:hypothetical protein
MTGADYLNSSMMYQEEIDKKSSLADVKSFLDTSLVPGSSPNYHYVNAAIYGKDHCPNADVHDYYYWIEQVEGGTKSNITNYTDRSQCDSIVSDYKNTVNQQILDYWQGKREPLSLDTPESKDPSKNPIRTTLYPWANNNSYCFKNSELQLDINTKVTQGQLLNLVYFQTIKSNFFKYFQNDVASVAAQTKDPDIKAALGKGSNLTRSDLIGLAAKMNAADPQSQQMKDLSFKMQNYLVNLDDNCANITWLDDGIEHIDRPPKFCTSPL